MNAFSARIRFDISSSYPASTIWTVSCCFHEGQIAEVTETRLPLWAHGAPPPSDAGILFVSPLPAGHRYHHLFACAGFSHFPSIVLFADVNLIFACFAVHLVAVRGTDDHVHLIQRPEHRSSGLCSGQSDCFRAAANITGYTRFVATQSPGTMNVSLARVLICVSGDSSTDAFSTRSFV